MNNSLIWDKISKDYSHDISIFEKDLVNDIIMIFNNVGITKQHTILEVGSGSGHLSALLAMDQYQVTLLDFSTESLEKSRQFFRKCQLHGDFIEADMLRLPVMSSYNVVWNSGVMEHFNNKDLIMVFKNLRKITLNYLIFLVPNPDSLPYMLYRFKLQKENRWNVGDEFIRKDYTPFLNASGFNLLEKRYAGWEITKNFYNYYNPKDNGIFNELVTHGFVSESNAYLIVYVCEASNCFEHLDTETINDERITEHFNCVVRNFKF